ncbi:MAG: 3-methyl-2-oxobutanoate dehydrogenase subunit VorB [Clostridiales bacterium]|nr:3-methyl-2-oxobutanoate dehydrogenase subunit VorB [Clostridiales bacterium]HOA84479.1 3-methyl-2-oxobutanoate dehydrogenase subunit VorB [Bacillota bacterium]
MSRKMLMKGNEAIAEAAICCGCLYFFGYPITPQSEISEYMAKRLPQVGGLCLQAESEVAAINMVLGAAASGVRVMTSSSSPGVSLMSEGISYLVGSDLPCLICNIQRGGPGLGGIQPAQQDYLQATKAAGHGDLHLYVVAPASVHEMAGLVCRAFDVADTYRIPALLLADGALGQMMEPVDFDTALSDRRNLPKKDWSASGHGGRRKKNVVNSLYLSPDELERSVLARQERYSIIESSEVLFEEADAGDAEIIIVAYGISARICKSAIEAARAIGIRVGLIRPITLWPYPKAALGRAAEHARHFLVVELNTGQMVDDVKLATGSRRPVSFFGRCGGMLPTPEDVLAEIIKIHDNIRSEGVLA